MESNPISLLILLIVVALVFWMIYRNNSPKKENLENCSQCELSYDEAKNEREERKGLLPILDPGFNLREVAKQMILLEDHLFNSKKRCTQCCIKHFLTIEGLAEEAITLDKERNYENLTQGLPEEIRRIEKMWLQKSDPIEVAQNLRTVRKTLQNACFDRALT